jgi:hypothetical protein
MVIASALPKLIPVDAACSLVLIVPAPFSDRTVGRRGAATRVIQKHFDAPEVA